MCRMLVWLRPRQLRVARAEVDQRTVEAFAVVVAEATRILHNGWVEAFIEDKVFLTLKKEAEVVVQAYLQEKVEEEDMTPEGDLSQHADLINKMHTQFSDIKELNYLWMKSKE